MIKNAKNYALTYLVKLKGRVNANEPELKAGSDLIFCFVCVRFWTIKTSGDESFSQLITVQIDEDQGGMSNCAFNRAFDEWRILSL